MLLNNSTETQPGKIFSARYISLPFIEFDESWLKENIYYDNIHQNIKLKSGEMVASYDEKNNKRLIIIGTMFGLIVVYDRYANQTNNGSYRYNVENCQNKIFHVILSGGGISTMQMNLLLGKKFDSTNKNIGHVLEEMASTFIKEAKWD
jgi:hypothetical protein